MGVLFDYPLQWMYAESDVTAPSRYHKVNNKHRMVVRSERGEEVGMNDYGVVFPVLGSMVELYKWITDLDIYAINQFFYLFQGNPLKSIGNAV